VWYPDYRTFWTWWLSENTTTKGEARVAHSNYITDSNEKMGVRPMIWLVIEHLILQKDCLIKLLIAVVQAVFPHFYNRLTFGYK
jgi:hypothetical protein